MRALRRPAHRETTVQDFDALFAVNVRAILLVQQLLPIMGTVAVSSCCRRSPTRIGWHAVRTGYQGAIDTLVKHFASAWANDAFASMPLRLAWYRPTCRTSPRQNGRDFTLGIQALKRMAAPEDIAARYFPRVG